MIRDYLVSRGNAKPRKVATLSNTMSNTINSLFMKVLSDKELNTLIDKLVQKKLITIEETKVHYNLK